MRIAFLTTQEITGSTVVGRVFPLAQELAKKHEIHILVHGQAASQQNSVFRLHYVGKDPFIRISGGKRRLKGIALIGRLKINAFLSAVQLFRIQPDVVIVTKSLPENVLAAWIAKLIFIPKAKFILDVDDFELTANALSSMLQRAAVHWAQRAGANIANHIVAATPFLKDYFGQLVPRKSVVLIPTGITSFDVASSTPTTPTLLYAGSVSLASGHRVDLLPEILKHVLKESPAAQLVIAGSGDDIPKLKQQFEKAGIQKSVRWTGRYDSGAVAKLLGEASVVLDPVDGSITNRAKSSFRVAAAMAKGKPVVSSNIGIRSYLIPAEFHSRFFAKPEHAAEYAMRVIDLLQKPLTETESDALKQHAMRYTWKVLAQEYLETIE